MRRLGRRAVSAAVASMALVVTLVSPAHAEKVTALQRWDSDNRYYVKADLDGRNRPELDDRAVRDHLRQGDWVKITCQTRGETAYGSDLWDKVDGLYVPDAYIRTHIDGPLSGAPPCTPNLAPRGSQARADVGWLMNRPYGEFLDFKAAAQNRANPLRLIWDDNGCSAPWQANLVRSRVGLWAGYFNGPCQQHDFGYRNYGTDGTGKGLSPTEDTRRWVDDRLRTEMNRVCDKIIRYMIPHDLAYFSERGIDPQSDCRSYAGSFHWAVRNFGEGAFSG